MHYQAVGLSTLLAVLVRGTHGAISLNLQDASSIRSAASAAASGLVQYYTGDEPGNVPGLLPRPYYWWESGAMFGSLVDYWYYTGDDTYNAITAEALMFQRGPDNNYNPPNQTSTLSIDDQGFWALAAMTAAETRFATPPNASLQWIDLAQNVFNFQTSMWQGNNSNCKSGGLKWQLFAFNSGYNIRNTISQGVFFQLGARLAVYTDNQTYAQWAEKAWDWTGPDGVGLFDDKYNFYDSVQDTDNCSDVSRYVWSYNAGVFLAGAAYMYNFTGASSLWEQRVRGIIDNLDIFFDDGVMQEVTCEDVSTCNVDQRAFKGQLARWMAVAITQAPFTRDLLKPRLESSATAAARACSGGSNGQECNFSWTNSTGFETGVGEQMNAMQIFQTNLVGQSSGTSGTANTTGSAGQGSGRSNTTTPANNTSGAAGTLVTGQFTVLATALTVGLVSTIVAAL